MKHHLVSIGISQHQNAEDNLQYAAKDASEFYKLFGLNLANQGYKKLLLDSEATLGQIRSAIGTELQESISPEDVFIFFYSGHGALGPNKEDPSIALNYLIPFDATYDFENSCISIEYLKNIFEGLKSKTNFIFIDSCFSGSLAKNTKGYHVPKTKTTYKGFKSFANTIIGNGTLIFTACKDDQQSLEDPEYKNGLFTYELFTELQVKRDGEMYDPLTIFSPIATRVQERAKTKWNHDQTPTFSGKLEGKVLFPVFKKKLEITPELIAVPRYSELEDSSFPVAQIDIPDKTKSKILNDTLKFVLHNKKNDEISEINYERYCIKLLRDLKSRWEEIFKENGSRVEEIPNSVAKLEAESFQLILLGAVTTVFGSDSQMNIFSKNIISILEWRQNKSGLVALISVPEVVLINIIYMVGTLGLASEKLRFLKILMETKLEISGDLDSPPKKLLGYNHIFFCDALGGYSNKVHDHVREVLQSFEWLPELVPSLEGKVENFQHQTNLLLSVWMMHEGFRMWPDFARFYYDRVAPFVKKLKFDEKFQNEICSILAVKKSEVRKIFKDSIEKYRRNGLGNFWWESIEGTSFLTKPEQENEE